jgi:hypothetical protein
VNTFLPYKDFERVAHVLDRQRLGKQRVEGLQILQALCGIKEGWKNHPATLMWKGAEPALITYVAYMCVEWKRRGFEDNIFPRLVGISKEFFGRGDLFVSDGRVQPAPWMRPGEYERVNATHQANLVLKDPMHYSQTFNMGKEEALTVVEGLRCCDECQYYWPTHPRRRSSEERAAVS